ncbi:MAG: ABC transporter ATP-binding protein [Patescibacteria group bacterium UBA2163]
MTQAAVAIHNLQKTYATGTVALNDVSLSIPQGEFFGLLGPNGAGKSTTIHCLTGIAMPTGGTLEVFGIDVVNDYRQARKKVGLSPQDFNVDIFARVWQILDYNAGFFGMPKEQRKERITELLKQFNLESHATKQFQHLSGGLKRRVMLARAMVHDPDLLILDEPTAGVDVEFRHELWDHLQRINEAGKTIILTSHYLEEVERLCSRIGIINNGTIVAEADRAEFMKDGDRLETMYLKLTKGEGR